MSLISVAIAVCWLLIGLIILCGIVYIALYVAKTFFDIPLKLEQAIIAALTLVAGGSVGHMTLSSLR